MQKTVKYRLMIWFGDVQNLPVPVYSVDGEEVWAFEDGIVWLL
jgi:hypothetical protein